MFKWRQVGSSAQLDEKGLAPEPREGPKGAMGVPRWTEPTTGPDLTLLSSALRWSHLLAKPNQKLENKRRGEA